MLEKPDLDDARISECLESHFSIRVQDITFLPLGADLDTAVYRAVALDGRSYFVKLRSGRLFRPAIALPKFLNDIGLRQVIPPIPGGDGQLWADLDPYRLILSEFIPGENGFEVPLTAGQWTEFGAVLKVLHNTRVPDVLPGEIPREDFSPRWRRQVGQYLSEIETRTYREPVAEEMAAYLRTQKNLLLDMIERADRLSNAIQKQPVPFRLCHADIHVGNLHIARDGSLYMIDWDTLKFAPRERDLMFVGGGLGGGRFSPDEEVELFYRGYGKTRIDTAILAYYRYDRVLEDIAIYCRQILRSDAGGADRPQSLQYLMSNFQPGGTIEQAYRAETSAPESV